jgi:predicted nucleic acid-binding protein
MRIFLDANVLFSAARNPDGNCAALVRLAGRRRCALLSSRFAIEEARRNLALKSPQALAAAIRARATVLMTGDQTHFGDLFGIEIAGVTTLLPAHALKHLMGL